MPWDRRSTGKLKAGAETWALLLSLSLSPCTPCSFKWKCCLLNNRLEECECLWKKGRKKNWGKVWWRRIYKSLIKIFNRCSRARGISGRLETRHYYDNNCRLMELKNTRLHLSCMRQSYRRRISVCVVWLLPLPVRLTEEKTNKKTMHAPHTLQQIQRTSQEYTGLRVNILHLYNNVWWAIAATVFQVIFGTKRHACNCLKKTIWPHNLCFIM